MLLSSARSHSFMSNRFLPTAVTLCEKHFVASDYIKTSKYKDMETGNIIAAPLKVFRRKQDAVPSAFPNCHQYISRQNACTWQAQKRKRVEDESIRISMEKSLEEKQQDKKNKVTSFSEFLHALPSFNHSPFWSVINMDSKVLFLDLTVDQGASVGYAKTA
ncbi:hypothetical protein HPB49_009226 [Dermacentor silvarum]|uniref:Uncharacterized protein n=1 Tax=Dermacentor silvarum TaxID=543639 RepID=A0ACB8DC01_DERSI|nr:hypothetical protein HPB49_009226 [Dermacentor silvarum]